jgi:DinB superfamily
MDRTEISAELRRVQSDFDQLVQHATAADLGRRTAGTRWTNRQLLFHMVFGYLIVRTLMPLVHTLGRLGWSRRFAATLNAAHRPFHLINYLGSVAGGQVLPPPAMAAVLTRTLQALQRRLNAETGQSLALTMHFPTAWDPYFAPTMNVLEVYHYGTQHYDHHRRQLTILEPGR